MVEAAMDASETAEVLYEKAEVSLPSTCQSRALSHEQGESTGPPYTREPSSVKREAKERELSYPWLAAAYPV